MKCYQVWLAAASRSALFFFVFISQTAHAAEWSVEPTISLLEEYNDNLQLATLPHKSVWGTTLSPAVDFNRKTDSDFISAGAKLGVRRYQNGAEFNRDDQFYTLSGGVQTERQQWALKVSLTRDADLRGIAGGGITQKQKDALTLNPSWKWMMTERNSLQLDYQYTSLSYLDSAGTNLTDYKYQTLSLNWQNQLNEQDQLSASVYDQRYITSTGSSKFKTAGMQVGLTHTFSESISSSVVLGWRNTKIALTDRQCVGGYPIPALGIWTCDPIYDQNGQPLITYNGSPTYGTWQNVVLNDSSNGSTFSVTLEKRGESFGMGGKFTQDVSPSGIGYLLETKGVNFWANDTLTENLTAAVNLYFRDDKYIGIISSSNNSRYYKIEPKLSWRMTEWWKVDAGYSWAGLKFQGATETARANNVYVNLTYNWPKVSVSR